MTKKIVDLLEAKGNVKREQIGDLLSNMAVEFSNKRIQYSRRDLERSAEAKHIADKMSAALGRDKFVLKLPES